MMILDINAFVAAIAEATRPLAEDAGQTVFESALEDKMRELRSWLEHDGETLQ